MGFTEITFLFVFLPFSLLIYFLVSRFKNPAASNLTLVLLSFVFYAWNGYRTLVLFFLLITAAFFLGRMIFYMKEGEESGRKKKQLLGGAAAVFAAVLAWFKYLPAAVSASGPAVNGLFRLSDLIAPIGLSFVVFEAISYLADIYRGDADPGSFLETLTFFSLFSKLVSGPIVRWKDFRPQAKERTTDLTRVVHGINRIIIGLAKKAIIADTFGAQIRLIETDISASGADVPTMWLRSLLFFFQLYYDFSGYSDIAIGISEIFGFSFEENFNYPYISRSITEFWRRWHISLGAWFREYVYIPMGGNRKGNVYFNLFFVFLLTGIWHGANWTFVLWGIVHGIFIVLERLVRNRPWYQKTPAAVKWLATMCIVFFAWVLFMSPDLHSAGETYKALFVSSAAGTPNFTLRYFLSRKILLLLAVAAAGAVAGAVPLPKRISDAAGTKAGVVIRQVLLIGLFAVDILFVVNSTYSPFMYFQF